MDEIANFDPALVGNITHGVYIIGVKDSRGRLCGSLVDCIMKATKTPYGVEVSTNKDTYTSNCIESSREFTISVVGEDAKADLIELFGCTSCRDTDKWAQTEHEMLDGLPVLKNCVCSYKVKVFHKLELSTHMLWSCMITDAKSGNGALPMTMAFLGKNLIGEVKKLNDERKAKQA